MFWGLPSEYRSKPLTSVSNELPSSFCPAHSNAEGRLSVSIDLAPMSGSQNVSKVLQNHPSETILLGNLDPIEKEAQNADWCS